MQTRTFRGRVAAFLNATATALLGAPDPVEGIQAPPEPKPEQAGQPPPGPVDSADMLLNRLTQRAALPFEDEGSQGWVPRTMLLGYRVVLRSERGTASFNIDGYKVANDRLYLFGTGLPDEVRAMLPLAGNRLIVVPRRIGSTEKVEAAETWRIGPIDTLAGDSGSFVFPILPEPRVAIDVYAHPPQGSLWMVSPAASANVTGRLDFIPLDGRGAHAPGVEAPAASPVPPPALKDLAGVVFRLETRRDEIVMVSVGTGHELRREHTWKPTPETWYFVGLGGRAVDWHPAPLGALWLCLDKTTERPDGEPVVGRVYKVVGRGAGDDAKPIFVEVVDVAEGLNSDAKRLFVSIDDLTNHNRFECIGHDFRSSTPGERQTIEIEPTKTVLDVGGERAPAVVDKAADLEAGKAMLRELGDVAVGAAGVRKGASPRTAFDVIRARFAQEINAATGTGAFSTTDREVALFIYYSGRQKDFADAVAEVALDGAQVGAPKPWSQALIAELDAMNVELMAGTEGDAPPIVLAAPPDGAPALFSKAAPAPAPPAAIPIPSPEARPIIHPEPAPRPATKPLSVAPAPAAPASKAGPPWIPNPGGFLENAGLVAEINRQVLHPLGLMLAFDPAAKGAVKGCVVGLLDHRSDPDGLVFDERTLQANAQRLAAYRAEHGGILETRRARLGYHVQPAVHPRYPELVLTSSDVIARLGPEVVAALAVEIFGRPTLDRAGREALRAVGVEAVAHVLGTQKWTVPVNLQPSAIQSLRAAALDTAAALLMLRHPNTLEGWSGIETGTALLTKVHAKLATFWG